jgi:hypothetical protein
MTENSRIPGIAAVLSFFFNGLGQLYNGQIFKGLLIIFISSVSIIILVIGAIIIGLFLLGKLASVKILILGLALFVGALISTCFLGIYSIVDAYRVAKAKCS